MTIFQKVKLALRISHNALDDEITDVIASARQEMIRAGVEQELANGSMDLVETAIKTYALAYFAGNLTDREKYEQSFQYQLDNIRKSMIEWEPEPEAEVTDGV